MGPWKDDSLVDHPHPFEGASHIAPHIGLVGVVSLGRRSEISTGAAIFVTTPDWHSWFKPQMAIDSIDWQHLTHNIIANTVDLRPLAETPQILHCHFATGR